MSLLNVKNLSLSRGSFQILHDVSIDIQPGEIVAITGESGSGKSLTALAVMGLLPHGSVMKGSIWLEKKNILTTSEHDLCSM